MLRNIRRFIIIIFSVELAAINFSSVLVPNHLIGPGLGGLAIVINNLTQINIQLLLALLCAPIIIWAIVKYDRRQVFYAGFCFVLFTISLGVIRNVVPPFVTDPIVATIITGLLFGISGGLIIREGVANGPEAIVGMYLKESKGITMGNFFVVLNFTIVFSSIVYGELTLIIYSLIAIYIAGKVTDHVILGTTKNYEVNVISDDYLEITTFIHRELKGGVTYVPCVGTYEVKKKMMLKTILNNTGLIKLKNYLKTLEHESFVYVTESFEVYGRGFTD